MNRIILVLITILFLSSCTVMKVQQTQTPKVSVTPKHRINLPTPKAMGWNLSAEQIASATYYVKGQNKSYTSEAHVDINSDKIILVAVSGFGNELYSIEYDGKHIKSDSLPIPNVNIGIEHTLIDFIFSYAPEEVLKDTLKNSGLEVQISSHQRIFTANSKKIIQIDYENTDPWVGKIAIHNVPLNYTVIIHTLNIAKKQ